MRKKKKKVFNGRGSDQQLLIGQDKDCELTSGFRNREDITASDKECGMVDGKA